MSKDVVVLLGTGSIGQAIARRVGAGKHIVLADLKRENAETAAKILENAGFETSTISTDLGSRESILKLVEHA
ncbi:MAG: SDR family NAD(P)-dependent oxidoreductase [Synergistaceae bacterium]|nr:SDR family NAD(P)-dependent oxidoreductase [Synergistaceae bacterium]